MRNQIPSQEVKPDQPTFDHHLDNFTTGVLKRWARLWVGKEANRMRKAACLEAIISGLADEQSVRSVVESLSELELAALGLLKSRGGVIPAEEMAMELWMLGMPFESKRDRRYISGKDFYDLLNSLLEKGLMMLGSGDPRDPYNYSSTVSEYNYERIVWTDRRLLEHVSVAPPAEVDISPATDVGATLCQQPSEVTLRFIGVIEGLRKAGRVVLTREGRPSKPFMAKLAKQLGWEDAFVKSPTPINDAVLFFFKLLERAGLLKSSPRGAHVVISPQSRDFFALPYVEQARAWIRAYCSISGWVEYSPESYWPRFEDRKLGALRAALFMALAALPDTTAWYHIEDI